MWPIVLPCYRRPDYTKRVLDALSVCRGIEDHPVTVYLDYPKNESHEIGWKLTLELLKSHPLPSRMVMRKEHHGNRAAVLAAMGEAFSDSDTVAYIEDDTVPGPDCLTYFDFCDSIHEKHSIFSGGAYRPKDPANIDPDPTLVMLMNWFNSWGFITWKKDWESVADKMPEDSLSWDLQVNALTRDRQFATPHLSRTQDIGARDGANVPSEAWHFEHAFNPIWSGDGRCLPYEFRLS